MNRIFLILIALNSLCTSVNAQDLDCKNESCIEKLHFDSVLVNNLPLLLATEELEAKLGKPDSIVTEYDWECGNFIDSETSVEMRYYGKTKFMSSKGKSLLYVINFEDSQFKFEFHDNIIQSGTTKTGISQYFPNAVTMFDRQVFSYNKKGRMKVLMSHSSGFDESSGWIFTFSDNKVKEIRLWWFIC